MSEKVDPDFKTSTKVTQARLFAEDAIEEYFHARTRFGQFSSGHEGLCVVWEEFLELQKFVFSKDQTIEEIMNARKECVQLAAMAMAFSVELIELDQRLLIELSDFVPMPHDEARRYRNTRTGEIISLREFGVRARHQGGRVELELPTSHYGKATWGEKSADDL